MGCVATVPEETVGIVEGGGKFKRLLFPGMHFLTPMLEVLAAVVNLTERNCSIELELNTKEFALVKFKVHAQYKVRDEAPGELIESNSNVFKAYYTVHDDLEGKLLEYIENNLRGQFRGYSLLHVFSKGDEIAKLLMEEADAEMHQYGFTVFNVGISDVSSQHDPVALAAEQAAAAAAAAKDDPSSGDHSAKEMFLDQCVYTTLDKYFRERDMELVSALQIVKMHRKFGREPAKRILVITKSVPTKDGPIRVEMHSFKREMEDEATGINLFKKKLVTKAEEGDGQDADGASYTLIRTYPLLRMKDVAIQDGMFVLSFEDKTPDLCISNLNARQVNAFINEAIKTCKEASGPDPGPEPSEPLGRSSSISAGTPKSKQAGATPATQQQQQQGSASKGGLFAGTKAALERNKQILLENKEKLSKMGDQSEEMANQAADFLAAVRRMRQQQESKKWYEL